MRNTSKEYQCFINEMMVLFFYSPKHHLRRDKCVNDSKCNQFPKYRVQNKSNIASLYKNTWRSGYCFVGCLRGYVYL